MEGDATVAAVAVAVVAKAVAGEARLHTGRRCERSLLSRLSILLVDGAGECLRSLGTGRK